MQVEWCECRLVASDSGDTASKNKSDTLPDSTKDIISSPIESSVSSETRKYGYL